jgi:hypothetical protein
MSIDPIDPISALIPVNMLNTFTVTPLKNGEAVEHAVQSNLQTIPPQSKGELV